MPQNQFLAPKFTFYLISIVDIKWGSKIDFDPKIYFLPQNWFWPEKPISERRIYLCPKNQFLVQIIDSLTKNLFFSLHSSFYINLLLTINSIFNFKYFDISPQKRFPTTKSILDPKNYVWSRILLFWPKINFCSQKTLFEFKISFRS